MRQRLLLLAPLLLAACQSDGEPTSEQKEKMLELYTETAQSYYQMGEVERAAGQAEKGLELDPDNRQLKLVLAWSLQRRGKTGDIARAEQLFRDTASSGDFRATLGLGDALERKGLAFAEAADKIESGERVTEAADPKQRVVELRAKAQECWREALGWYQATIEKQRDNSDAHSGVARVQMLLGQRAEALASAERAIEIVSADYAFWEQRVRSPDVRVEEERRLRSLMGRLQKILVATHMTAYQLCVDLDQKDKALAHVDAAVALDPKRPECYSRRAQLQLERGEYAAAIKDIDQFLAASELAFEHPDMRKAWQIRRDAENALKRERQQQSASGG